MTYSLKGLFLDSRLCSSLSGLCLRTFGTFAFAPTAQADPHGKTKRAKSPTRSYDHSGDYIN
jgi:hypothetical protein